MMLSFIQQASEVKQLQILLYAVCYFVNKYKHEAGQHRTELQADRTLEEEAGDL